MGDKSGFRCHAIGVELGGECRISSVVWAESSFFRIFFCFLSKKR